MKKTLFEVVTGSKAYGLDFPGSDTDVFQVVVHGMENYLGLAQYKSSSHFKAGDEDVAAYDLRFFSQMILKGSFNAVLPLFYPVKFVRVLDSNFKPFLENKRLLISESTLKSFHGYGYRMLKDFENKQDFKGAANGLYILKSLLVILEGQNLSEMNVEVLRAMKRKILPASEVEAFFGEYLERTRPEVLVEKYALNSVDSVEALLSRLCVQAISS